ncbi:ferredoxin [Actinomadura scrupuli]|uniref:ferredoxin n=1 Tax=Actinomadura scrupuli TaxID=559629 RepID=UPI003D97AF3F
MAAMKVVVDRVKCAGLGICEAQSPGTFEIDENGEVVILDEEVGPDRLEEIRDTVASCPTRALSLVED